MRHALIVLLLAPLAASAGLYTWTDADGHKHFGDKAPAGAQEIEEKKAYSPGADANVKAIQQRTGRLLDAADQKQQDDTLRQNVTAQNAEKHRQACADAREREEKLSGRLVFVDRKSGTIDKDSDAIRAQKLQETRDWIAAHCN